MHGKQRKICTIFKSEECPTAEYRVMVARSRDRRVPGSNPILITIRRGSTRGPFWDGPSNFEPRSDDEDGAWVGSPSPGIRVAPTGGCLVPYVRFGVQRAQCTTDIRWNRVSGLEPFGPKAESLPLGHRGPGSILK
ncbi:hypothetical protein AVEN_4141-1 [Araneus ventricosus]|uniref:Uncharacterized protein n=1 Tax=Araneus ventricosus TaxID=182803 RepID=A0A4Y2VEF4_ARAVE|nr:hypothetical protein AVEN_4141-1 [Araneus ventricosus]